jgi:hypothetical protein
MDENEKAEKDDEILQELREVKKDIDEIKEGIKRSRGYAGALPPEIAERVGYSARRAKYISRVSEDGIALLCMPEHEDLSSFTESGLHVLKKVNNIHRKTLRAALKKFRIDRKNLKEMKERDVFVFLYNDEPFPENFIKYGISLVKGGKLKSLHFFNVNPEDLTETAYAIGHTRKPVLNEIVKQGAYLVKEGKSKTKGFLYLNLYPGKDKEVKYNIDPSGLERSQKLRDRIGELNSNSKY